MQVKEHADMESSNDDISRLAKLLDQHTVSAVVGHEHDSNSELISPRVEQYVNAKPDTNEEQHTVKPSSPFQY